MPAGEAVLMMLPPWPSRTITLAAVVATMYWLTRLILSTCFQCSR